MNRIYSEKELNLQPRWFTGQEWKNGTAERELKREYFERIKEIERPRA